MRDPGIALLLVLVEGLSGVWRSGNRRRSCYGLANNSQVATETPVPAVGVLRGVYLSSRRGILAPDLDKPYFFCEMGPLPHQA